MCHFKITYGLKFKDKQYIEAKKGEEISCEMVVPLTML